MFLRFAGLASPGRTRNGNGVWRGVTSGNLCERVGGEAAVDAAVDLFYRKVLTDPAIGHFFDNVDMDEQRGKRKAFLSMVFGGPNTYGGKDLRSAHAGLVGCGLDDSHFDAVAGHL